MNNQVKILSLFLAVCLMSCSKKESTPAEIKTYGVVTNSSSSTLERVLVGYFDNDAGKTVLLASLGDMAPNSSSAKFEISNEKVITDVYVYFGQGELPKMIVPSFQLFRHIDNSFELSNVKVSDAYNVERNGPHYPH